MNEEPYCNVCRHSHLVHKFSSDPTVGFCRVENCNCGKSELPVGAVKEDPPNAEENL